VLVFFTDVTVGKHFRAFSPESHFQLIPNVISICLLSFFSVEIYIPMNKFMIIFSFIMQLFTQLELLYVTIRIFLIRLDSDKKRSRREIPTEH